MTLIIVFIIRIVVVFFILLYFYIDDILIVDNDVASINKFKYFLKSHFEMKDLGKASCVLGIQVPKRRGVMAKSLRSAQQVSSSSQDMHLL
jgi:hypothetical protein